MMRKHSGVSWQLSLLLTLLELSSWTVAFHSTLCPSQHRLPTHLFRQSDSKWDNLVDEEDDELELVPARPDMKYNRRNVGRQQQNFQAIRDAGGKELTIDVYVPEPDSEIFWFVGKAARISDVSVEQAIARQWPLIVQHAANLRPIELYPSRSILQVWTASGDSEMEVAYNRPDPVFEKMTRDVKGAETIKSNTAGFQGEIYEKGQGMGFRTWRDQDGKPTKPEVSGPSEQDDNKVDYSDPKFRAPSEEELENLQEALKDSDMDIGQLYEEYQQKLDKESNDLT